MHVRAWDPADAMTSHLRPDVDVETCKSPLPGAPTVGVFGPPTSKFVFARLSWMVCSEDTRVYTGSTEHPYVQFAATRVTGTWFIVGVTNRRERERIPSLWWK